MDEKNETTSRESAVGQPAGANVEDRSGQGQDHSGDLSFEEELRAAYAELEAARAKLEEIKARKPPIAADSVSSEPNWVPYTPPEQEESSSQGAVASDAGDGVSAVGDGGGQGAASYPAGQPQGYQPPSYGQQPRQPQQPFAGASYPGPQAQQPASQTQPAQAQPADAWAAQPQQPYGTGFAAGQSQPFQQPYRQPYYPSSYVQTKDHVAAGLLGIFLGWLGIHKFYLGYSTTGFIMLAVTVLGSLFTFGLAASVMALIGVIEGIVYLVKSQSEFEQLYVFNKREWF